MGRRTEIGFEAVHPRVSGRTSAKLSRPKGCGVYPATVQRRPCILPGEISLVPERVTPASRSEAGPGDRPRDRKPLTRRGRSEKSAEAIVAAAKPDRGSSAEDGRLWTVKGQTERRAKRP